MSQIIKSKSQNAKYQIKRIGVKRRVEEPRVSKERIEGAQAWRSMSVHRGSSTGTEENQRERRVEGESEEEEEV